MGDIICHPIELEQVVLNLLRNAAQSVATQGAALKETGAEEYRPTIHLRTRREDDWAVIEIEDNGTGMSAATRRRIFEPFFTTKQAGQGTGLGLSVSYFIITKNHGGTLTVDSQEGEGTTFTIRIPVNGPAAVRTQDSFT
ncbi:sensor histidine kinase [Oleidesulfovibrio alaskensis]